jgi:hypothetical protein
MGAVMAERQQQQLLECVLALVLIASRAFDASEASKHNRPRDAQATEMATERNAASAREGIQTEFARWELYDISGAVNPAPEMREQSPLLRLARKACRRSPRRLAATVVERLHLLLERRAGLHRDFVAARVRAQSRRKRFIRKEC